MKTVRVIAAVVVIAGACLSGRALYLHAKAILAGIFIRRAWLESISRGKPCAPWPWADTQPVARLRIPRLRYDEIVLEGATPRTLAFGPARVMSGAAFGEPGNLMLAGHRTSWFHPLEGIAQGDTIWLDWFDGQGQLHQRSYSVESVRVVQPEDVVHLMPTTQDSLTLITCYPFGRSPRSPQRFVVLALPWEQKQSKQQPTQSSTIVALRRLSHFDVLPVLKAGDSCREAHGSISPPRVSAADGLTAPFTRQTIRAVVSHPVEASTVSSPSSRNTPISRERMLMAETSSA